MPNKLLQPPMEEVLSDLFHHFFPSRVLYLSNFGCGHHVVLFIYISTICCAFTLHNMSEQYAILQYKSSFMQWLKWFCEAGGLT